MQQRRAQLVGIVRGNVGRHADGDAGRAVGEQVGERRRQHRRLHLAPVVVGAEVDRLLFQPLEQVGGGRCDARFGVALGGRVIAVDVAEVALAVDQRVAHGEVLRQAGERVVDRLVAVRMVVAHGVADDLGALEEAAVRRQPQLVHGIEDAPVHGLQAVAHIGQRAVHDGRQRVRQIALFQRHPEVDRLVAVGAGQNRFFGHRSWLARPGRPGKTAPRLGLC